MLNEKKKKISAIGVFTYNIMAIDNHTLEWIDVKDFNLANLAKLIGIDEDHNVKAKITLEVVEEPCELCGRLTTGDKLCTKCGKTICDECAKTDASSRYCPICFDREKSFKDLCE